VYEFTNFLLELRHATFDKKKYPRMMHYFSVVAHLNTGRNTFIRLDYGPLNTSQN